MPEAQITELMTAKQVAAALNLSQQQVYHLERIGAIPGIRIGSAVRFDRDVISVVRRKGTPWHSQKGQPNE